MTDAGAFAGQHLCDYSDTENRKVMDALADGGAAIHEIAADEATQVSETIAPVVDEWAEDLESQGKPGRKTVEAFRAAVQASN